MNGNAIATWRMPWIPRKPCQEHAIALRMKPWKTRMNCLAIRRNVVVWATFTRPLQEIRKLRGSMPNGGTLNRRHVGAPLSPPRRRERMVRSLWTAEECCQVLAPGITQEKEKVAKNSGGCKFCLSTAHKGKPLCPFVGKWRNCDVGGCYTSLIKNKRGIRHSLMFYNHKLNNWCTYVDIITT